MSPTLNFREGGVVVNSQLKSILTWNVVAGSIVFLFIFIVIRRVYWDPLSKYPGPRLWAATRLPYTYYTIIGQFPYVIDELHKKYGPVVRVAPNELSYACEEAWNDIYNRTKDGEPLRRDPKQFFEPPSGIHGLMTHPVASEHARMRRNLSHAFSEKALREQEPLITQYFDKLMQRLQEASDRPVDIVKMFNLVTFDIVSDLTFGESFDGLETSELHFWVEDIFKFIKGGTIVGMTLQYPPLDSIVMWLATKVKAIREKEQQNRELITAKLRRRLELKQERPDFLSQIQKTLNTPTGVSVAEAVEICTTIIVGGSETTATLLSGCLWHLCLNPAILARLTAEVRGAFIKEEEITFVSVNKLEYLLAVLNEALRIMPPAPGSFHRVTPPQGSVIAKQFVPGNTVVAVNEWAASRSPSNFHRPDDFCPERWGANPPAEFANDRRKASQPFIVGPRNCIGRNLAYAEMRVLLARLVWKFDVGLCEESRGWGKDLKVWVIYEKPSLWLDLKPRA